MRQGQDRDAFGQRMVEGWKGNEKRVTKEPPKQHGGHRKPGGVQPRAKPEPKKAR